MACQKLSCNIAQRLLFSKQGLERENTFSSSTGKAVFLDKDGTLVRNVPYDVNPAHISLLEGVAPALQRFSAAGYRLIVITNQPGLSLGKFSEPELAHYLAGLSKLLRNEGIEISRFYWCPHGPSSDCSCRKPGSALFFRAASEIQVTLEGSWMVGDILDDIEAGKKAGCRSILINNGNETEWRIDSENRIPDLICRGLEEASSFIQSPPQARMGKSRHDANFAAWQTADNILCVRLDALGDVLMTSPAISALKRSRVGRTITLLTSSGGSEAARLNPHVDRVITFDAPWVKNPESFVSPCRELLETIRGMQFDAAVIFTVYTQSALPAALFCHLAGIPLRLAHCRENPYHLLTDWVEETEPEKEIRHEAARQMDLVATVGACAVDERLDYKVSPQASGRIARMLADRPWKERPLVVIHPGASAPSRRYRPEKFAEVARNLTMQAACNVVFTGSASEREIVLEVQRSLEAETLSLAGVLSVAELAALLSQSDLLISNNTGPVHLAAAVGTPVVDIYALTNPQHTPWMVENRTLSHDVPCKYCYKSVCPEGHNLCIDGVPPREIVEAALELLYRTKGCQSVRRDLDHPETRIEEFSGE